MNKLKFNFYISLVYYLAMTLWVGYGQLTYVPVLNPVDNVEVRLDGVQFFGGYVLVFLISLLLFCVLSLFTLIRKLISRVRAIKS